MTQADHKGNAMDIDFRRQIFVSHGRTSAMSRIVDDDHAETVTVDRNELRLILAEHSLMCGFLIALTPTPERAARILRDIERGRDEPEGVR